MHTQKMGRYEWGLLFVLSVLWGGSFFFFKVLVDANLPAFTIVFGRVAIAALSLLFFVRITGRRMPSTPATWGAFALMGMLNNVLPFTLIVFGETRIASGLASILNATTPIFTVLAAHVATRDEKLTLRKAVAVLLGFAGVVVLIGPDTVRGLHLTSVAQLACLAAACSYGFAGIYGRRFKKMGIDPVVTATGQVCASSMWLAPLVAIVDRPWTLPHAPGMGAWLAWIALALLCTALAYLIYFRILSVAGATNLLLVTLLIPISALALGALALGEAVSWNDAAGMVLIFAGLAAIDGRLLGAFRKIAGRSNLRTSE